MNIFDLYKQGLNEEPYWYGEYTLLAWAARLAKNLYR